MSGGGAGSGGGGRGAARARGGVSVVNALATGLGASMAVDLFVEARVALRDDGVFEVRIADQPEEPTDLVRLVVHRVLDAHGLADSGAIVETRSDIPPSRGLKSSSAAANAVALATDAAACAQTGKPNLARDRLLSLGIDAALEAGVTVTGAYDDAYASMHGGVAVTDNRARSLLARHAVPRDAVAILLVPPRMVRKTEAGKLAYAGIAPAARAAHKLALGGDVVAAMAVNGLAYGSLYGSDLALARRAVEAGASAAGVTGTGPAIAALARREVAEDVAAVLRQGGGETRVVALSDEGAEVIPC